MTDGDYSSIADIVHSFDVIDFFKNMVSACKMMRINDHFSKSFSDHEQTSYLELFMFILVQMWVLQLANLEKYAGSSSCQFEGKGGLTTRHFVYS